MNNLQYQSLYTYASSGNKHEAHPVIDNILFSMKTDYYSLNADNSSLRFRAFNIVNYCNNKHEIMSKSIINVKYDSIVSEISVYLFDKSTYQDDVRTVEQAMLKEYYHALYDIVVISDHLDATYHNMMLAESIAYYDVFDVPEPLLPNDPLYPNFSYIKDLFRQLRAETELLVAVSFKDTARKELLKMQRLRTELININILLNIKKRNK